MPWGDLKPTAPVAFPGDAPDDVYPLLPRRATDFVTIAEAAVLYDASEQDVLDAVAFGLLRAVRSGSTLHVQPAIGAVLPVRHRRTKTPQA